jgi:hypothetical protein
MNMGQARARIETAFESLTTASDQASYTSLLPTSLTAGKLYEAYVLSRVAEKLVTVEGYDLRLINSSYLPLKSSPGPLNRSYPRIDLRSGGRVVAEMWTDVEFLCMSYCMDRSSRSISRGDYHELDILIVDPGVSGRPRHDQIWLGVECKNTGYQKSLLKEILGIRRELGLLRAPHSTKFSHWPRARVPSDPASCLVVFSSDQRVREFSAPGDTFGIDFIHEEIPP